MIKKTSKGFQVKSESGKNLSKPNLSKRAAQRLLEQVELELGADHRREAERVCTLDLRAEHLPR